MHRMVLAMHLQCLQSYISPVMRVPQNLGSLCNALIPKTGNPVSAGPSHSLEIGLVRGMQLVVESLAMTQCQTLGCTAKFAMRPPHIKFAMRPPHTKFAMRPF